MNSNSTHAHSSWASKLAQYCRGAFADEHGGEAGGECYSNDMHVADMMADATRYAQAAENAIAINHELQEKETKHKIEQFWLRSCEVALETDHAASDIGASSDLNQPTQTPCRTSWHDFDPTRAVDLYNQG